MKSNPIVIVAGEPNSIFFEIFFKALKKKKFKSPIILICNNKLLMQQMKLFNFNKKLKIFKINEIENYKFYSNYLNVIDVNLGISLNDLRNKNNIKNYLKTSFNIAFKLIRNGLTNKLINGPINKKVFLEKKYLGVTEYISNNFNESKVGMLIYNNNLSVCPITTHLPIKLVANRINRNLISDKIEIIDRFFKEHLKKKAKIGVVGLNPHCESILRLNEDEKIIPSIIKTKAKKGINVKGPYPADTIFLKDNRKKFNVILGMYHDQVLGPMKSLFEYDAINITMGLPFLRVSPDHGPNSKMFKKNKSNPLSLLRALEFLDTR